MAENVDIQRRVERLISGQWNTRDLDRIYTWLRFRSYGHGVVRDIGDFTAHLEDRDQGLTWKRAQLLNDAFAYQMPKIEAHGTGKKPDIDVSTLKKGLMATLELDAPETVRKRVGMGKDKARAALKSICRKFDTFDGETVILNSDASPNEPRVFEFYTRLLITTPAFDAGVLAAETFEVLVRNQIIKKSDKQRFESVSPFLALFAIERMHQARLRLPGKKHAQLTAGYDKDGMLYVAISTPIGWRGQTQSVGVSFFQTQLLASEWCKPELVESGPHWDHPLEIIDRRLCILA